MKLLLLTFQKGFIVERCTSQLRTEKSAVKERIKFKTKMKIFERWWKSTRKFQDFCSSELKTSGVFNGVVVGFEPKGMPGKMCDSVRYKCGHTKMYFFFYTFGEYSKTKTSRKESMTVLHWYNLFWVYTSSLYRTEKAMWDPKL